MCIPLVIMTLSILPCSPWPILYLLYRSDYSSPLPIFESDFFFFSVLLSFRSSLSGSDIRFAHIFSHFVAWLFTPLIVSFAAQCFNIHEVNLSIFLFCLCLCYIQETTTKFNVIIGRTMWINYNIKNKNLKKEINWKILLRIK